MRWLAAALGISVAMFGAPAMAGEDLSLPSAGLAPVGDPLLALASAAADSESIALTATSSLQASISHASAPPAGASTTGNITLGDVSGAIGGMASLQLSSGFSDIQQDSIALAFSF